MKSINTIIRFGPLESAVISRLGYEKVTLVTTQQFANLFNFDPERQKQIIYRLSKKNILRPIKRGLYLFSPLEYGPDGRSINEFLIAPFLFSKGNYYIGYETMYNYYGFTDQIFQQLTILNTTQDKKIELGNLTINLKKIAATRLYGFEKKSIQNSVVQISDYERTLIDLIYFPSPVGGFNQAALILKREFDKKKIDIKKLVEYLIKFPSLSTKKRVGYLLEESGIARNFLSPLIKEIKGTSIISFGDTISRKGKINKTWRIILNEPQ